MSDLTAEDIKDVLRRRHPAREWKGTSFVGRWTCIEEWMNIDLLALDAWQPADVIGYEVKVSRGDMRSELLKPFKRQIAVTMTTQFYFAVPEGLLSKEELEYEEPEWEPGDFDRVPCPEQCFKPSRRHSRRSRVLKGQLRVPVPVVLSDEWSGAGSLSDRGWTYTKCPTCQGKTYVEKSRVEQEAPTLWVPRDVGLIEVYSDCSFIRRRSPRRPTPALLVPPPNDRLDDKTANRVSRQHINQLVRWVSKRPDPRH